MKTVCSGINEGVYLRNTYDCGSNSNPWQDRHDCPDLTSSNSSSAVPVGSADLTSFGRNYFSPFCMGGRHFVDIIGDISWTKGVTSRGHFWRHFVDKNVHEMSSFWVTFRGHFLDDISWTFFG